MKLEDIQTPAVIADMAMMQHNLKKFQAYADEYHVALRPHIKTHKIPRLAQMQIDYGAVGITCAKLGEAEVMADGGIKDIFMAYPVIGEQKIQRYLNLSERIRMICSVDSLEGAEAISKAAAERGIIAEVRMELDIGAHRTGVIPEKVLEFGKRIQDMPHLNLSGIWGYKSTLYQGKATLDAEAAGLEEGRILAEAAEELRSNGVNIQDVSAGSTPTARHAAKVKGITEVRPGTYIFEDAKRIIENPNPVEECCGFLKVTVVCAQTPFRAVIDAGTKALAGDSALHVAPMFLESHGRIIGHEGLKIVKMNEEHGMLVSEEPHGLHVGDTLYVIPNHICTCINLVDNIYIKELDGSYTETRVAARGKSV